jgi:thymidylate synthase
MSHPEMQYLKLIHSIFKEGRSKKSRGIHDLKSLFGYQMRFDLRSGFPLLTTKKMPFKILVHELLWFISGETNIKYLQENGIKYWDEFADENGDLGPVYGQQWRKWPDHKGNYIDQLANVIEEIKDFPNSKAMIVTAWNPGQTKDMRLPPCHAFFQFNVTKGKLRMQLYQRSSDVFLGLPFNIAQYALLLMMVAQVTGLEARELIVSIGDAHLYTNHLDSAKTQLKRKPFKFPTVKLNSSVKNIDDFKIEDFELTDYEYHPHIKADLVII